MSFLRRADKYCCNMCRSIDILLELLLHKSSARLYTVFSVTRSNFNERKSRDLFKKCSQFPFQTWPVLGKRQLWAHHFTSSVPDLNQDIKSFNHGAAILSLNTYEKFVFPTLWFPL